ncbi:hypothetical protein ACU8KH_05388 [Lachancea thermotolerans]
MTRVSMSSWTSSWIILFAFLRVMNDFHVFFLSGDDSSNMRAPRAALLLVSLHDDNLTSVLLLNQKSRKITYLPKLKNLNMQDLLA